MSLGAKGLKNRGGSKEILNRITTTMSVATGRFGTEKQSEEQ
jgi:hypothetical protein